MDFGWHSHVTGFQALWYYQVEYIRPFREFVILSEYDVRNKLIFTAKCIILKMCLTTVERALMLTMCAWNNKKKVLLKRNPVFIFCWKQIMTMQNDVTGWCNIVKLHSFTGPVQWQLAFSQPVKQISSQMGVINWWTQFVLLIHEIDNTD